ncbi:MAG: DUF4280 domain-containing protein [Defluviitaleaceae bacterium]|nr:DUF4280 domain-containing protein [Defluviitaleaceae bacterium]
MSLLGRGLRAASNWVSERIEVRNSYIGDGTLATHGSQVDMAASELDSRVEDFLAEREEARAEHAEYLRESEEHDFGEEDELFIQEEYLVRGADLFCTYGSHTRKLNLPKCHGVYITDAPVIHELDCVPIENISSFGVCSAAGITNVNPTPPNVLLEKTIYNEYGEAVGTENVRGRACTPQIASTWLNTYDDTRIVDNGRHNPSDRLQDEPEGYPAVTTESFIVCACGGIIQPITSGQNREEVIHEAAGKKAKLMAIKGALAGKPNILEHEDEEAELLTANAFFADWDFNIGSDLISGLNTDGSSETDFTLFGANAGVRAGLLELYTNNRHLNFNAELVSANAGTVFSLSSDGLEVGAGAMASLVSGGGDLAIPIPWTNFQISLGVEGHIAGVGGEISKEITRGGGRITKRKALFLGVGLSIGWGRRDD